MNIKRQSEKLPRLPETLLTKIRMRRFEITRERAGGMLTRSRLSQHLSQHQPPPPTPPATDPVLLLRTMSRRASLSGATGGRTWRSSNKILRRRKQRRSNLELQSHHTRSVPPQLRQRQNTLLRQHHGGTSLKSLEITPRPPVRQPRQEMSLELSPHRLQSLRKLRLKLGRKSKLL